MEKPAHMYSVLVDDNYNLPPDSDRYKLGDYATLEEAIAACKRMVDDFLDGHPQPGEPAEERFKGYAQYGPDPFIVSNDPDSGVVAFSAWEYAKQRCEST